MARVLAWVTTAVFLPVFGIILLVFEVAQRLARLLGQRPQEYVAGALQVALVWAFRLCCGVRLRVERAPEFRPWTSYIVVSNHQSMFDIPLLGTLLFSNFPKYISKRELGRWIPSVSYNLRQGGHVLIDRGDSRTAVTAIRELGTRVDAGRASAAIFPEGTRARHGTLAEFKRAGTVALLETAPATPVVPVTIDGSWRLLRHNLLPVPWGVHVRIAIGAPMARHPGESPDAVLARVRDHIAQTIERWREDERSAPPRRRRH